MFSFGAPAHQPTIVIRIHAVAISSIALPRPFPSASNCIVSQVDSVELRQTSTSTPLLALSLAPPPPLLNGMATSPRNPPPLFVLPLSPPPHPPDTALAGPPLPNLSLSLSRSPPFLSPSVVSLAFPSKLLDDAFMLPRIIPSRNALCTKTRISKLLQQDSRHRRCHRRARRPRQRPLMPRNPYHARSRTSIPVTRLVDRSDLARVFADEDVEGVVEDPEEV
ncbi:hypothetical protein EI94DRAFT_1758673 [Lactarius quietus]|nr:hypothetical protein EI94DRAFT_1758673 [Lactarius quietus]